MPSSCCSISAPRAGKRAAIRTRHSIPPPICAATPDVARSGLNPFYHFLFAGQREYRQVVPAAMPATVAQMAFGFDPGDWVGLMRPAIDEDFYIAQLGPGFDGSFNPAAHYCYRGWLDGLDPNPDFSVRNALALWPSLRLDRLNPLPAAAGGAGGGGGGGRPGGGGAPMHPVRARGFVWHRRAPGRAASGACTALAGLGRPGRPLPGRR